MKTILILICTLISTLLFSQVGIGTTHPDPSAILDIYSTSKGVLLPRLFKCQVKKMKPSNGTIVYVIDAHTEWFHINDFSFPINYGRLWVYDGRFWGEIPTIVKL